MAEEFGEQQPFFCVLQLFWKKKKLDKNVLSCLFGYFFGNSAEVRASYWIIGLACTKLKLRSVLYDTEDIAW